MTDNFILVFFFPVSLLVWKTHFHSSFPVLLLFSSGSSEVFLPPLLFRFLFFLILTIFLSSSISLSFSIFSSFALFFHSLSPKLAVNLGNEQRLYSDFELRILWLLSSWMITDSTICLSNALLLYLTTLTPNLIFLCSGPHSSSCFSIACFSIWLAGCSCSMLCTCSQDHSNTLLLVSPK